MKESIKIHVLHCGQVIVDIAVPFHQKSLNPFAYTGLFRSKKYQVSLPVSAYLIEHPKGLVLIDTGWHSDMRGDQIKNMGRLHYMITKPILPENQAIDEQLQKRGIKAKDLDYVILSHLHTDHVSGLKLVRDAKNIMTSEEEWQCAQKDKLSYVQHMWEGVNVKTFHMAVSEYGPFHRSFDLFDDDSVIFAHAPSDTQGLVTTIIQRNGKFVLLASDCGYAKKSWEEMALPGVMANKKKLIESLLWVKNLSQNPNCIEAIANHDAEVREHMIEL